MPAVKFREDLVNIGCTTLSSKVRRRRCACVGVCVFGCRCPCVRSRFRVARPPQILNVDKRFFAELAVDAVLRLKGSTDLTSIQIIKKVGGSLNDSFLDEGFILDKQIGVGQPRRIENARILVANTAMDTDKIKIFGACLGCGGVLSLSLGSVCVRLLTRASLL